MKWKWILFLIEDFNQIRMYISVKNINKSTIAIADLKLDIFRSQELLTNKFIGLYK